MGMGITIRMGAAQDSVSFMDKRTGKVLHTVDRAEARANRDRVKLQTLTQHVIEETDTLSNRAKRRVRRFQAEKHRQMKARNEARSEARH